MFNKDSLEPRLGAKVMDSTGSAKRGGTNSIIPYGVFPDSSTNLILTSLDNVDDLKEKYQFKSSFKNINQPNPNPNPKNSNICASKIYSSWKYSSQLQPMMAGISGEPYYTDIFPKVSSEGVIQSGLYTHDYYSVSNSQTAGDLAFKFIDYQHIINEDGYLGFSYPGSTTTNMYYLYSDTEQCDDVDDTNPDKKNATRKKIFKIYPDQKFTPQLQNFYYRSSKGDNMT